MDNRELIIEYIYNNIFRNDNDMGKLVAALYKNVYCISTDDGKEKWFKFNGERWITSNSIKYELRNKLSDEVAPLFAEARVKFRDMITFDELCSDEKVRLRFEYLFKAEQMLYNAARKNKIMKECESRLYRDRLPEY